MKKNSQKQRKPQAGVDKMFVDRWSPRSFRDRYIVKTSIKSIFEAARWAPSCYNEQPWFFLYAVKKKDRAIFLSLLAEKNQAWAKKAPVLVFVLAARKFAMTGKSNRHAGFDSGAAWMSMALEARKLGLYAHAMAGFHLDKAYKTLCVPEKDYDILAAVAVGWKGAPEDLPEEFKEMESPNGRKDLKAIYREGFFKKSG